MKNNKFIDYLSKYEELKKDIEKLRVELSKLSEECKFIQSRIVIRKIIDKQNLIEKQRNEIGRIKWILVIMISSMKTNFKKQNS